MMSLNSFSSIEDIGMPKEWEPTEFERYWLLMEHIETAPRYKSTTELHIFLENAGFGVNKRTVQRILNYFSVRHDLESRKRTDERGQPLEWAWSRSKGRPVVGDMDPPTALVYELAGQLLEPLLPSSYLDGMERDFRRARKVLRQVNKTALSLTNNFRILPRGGGRLPTQVDQTVLNELYDALFANKQVEVSYLAPSVAPKEPKSYVLNPLAIVFRFDILYLLYVSQPDDPYENPDVVKGWPIQRFKRVTRLDKPARRPPGFNLDEYLRAPDFLRNFAHQKLDAAGPTLRLKAISSARTAQYIQERPFSEDQKLTKCKDGRVRIEATVGNTQELLTELRNFAPDVEILGPKPLRDYFKNLSRQMHSQYCE